MASDYVPARQESEDDRGGDGSWRGSGEDENLQRTTPRRETDQTWGTGETGETCETGDTESTSHPVLGSTATANYGITPNRRHRRSGPYQAVSRDLKPWQIFFIVISGTIGLGLFTDSGEILNLAGPCGGLVAFVLVALLVIFVMSGIAEMIHHWPISGALVEFVRSFIDGDLAIIVGIAYWAAYSITFGTLVSALLDLGSYWAWARIWQISVFGLLAPALAVTINCWGVKVYGFIESIMGLLKLILVFGVFVLMCVINNRGSSEKRIGSKYISDGFKNDPRITSSPFIALLAGIPIAAYAFAGVEIIAVTAIEARDPPNSLKWPAKSVAIILMVVYVISVMGFYLNVSWQDLSLPSMISRNAGLTKPGTSIIMIATVNSNIPHAANILNGCLIVTVFSAANTTLYVASRTLFGIARGMDTRGSWCTRQISIFGTTNPKTNVPQRAVLISVFSVIWIPWIHAGSDFSDQWLQQIMCGIATTSIILVWASQCWAFIQYRRWLSKHPHELHGAFAQYHNEQISNGPLSHLQPFLAWLGFIGCFLIIFFSTASWWQWGKPSARDVLATWIVPVLALLSWVIMKQFSTTRNGRWGMNNDLDWNALKIELCRLTDLINDEGAIADDEQGGLSQSRYQVDGSEVNGRELMDSPQDTESRPNVLREPSLQKPLQNLQNTAREEEIGTEE